MDGYLGQFVGQGHRSKVKVTRSKNCSMGFSIESLLEFIDAFIDGDGKEETEEYDYCTETTWGVFKAYAFFLLDIFIASLLEICLAFFVFFKYYLFKLLLILTTCTS